MDPVTRQNRAARIVELRAARVPFRDIARELGISHQRCQQIYADTLAKIPVPHVNQHREEEKELADTVVRELLVIARDKSEFASVRVKAYDSLIRMAERKARLLGLDAPVKRELEITDTASWEFQMRQELAQMERDLAMARASQESAGTQ